MARSRRAEPMDQLVPVLLLVALFLVIVVLMRLGWRRRGRSQADLPAPQPDTPLDEIGETAEIGPLEAVYVATVLADLLPAPQPDTPLDEIGETAEIGPLEAVYVATVLADQPLERVVAHGLGARSTAQVTVGSAGTWRLERSGAPSLTIAADTVETNDSAPGMVGKFIGGDGVLVIRWRLGDHLLDTGLRLAHRFDHDLLLSRKEHS